MREHLLKQAAHTLPRFQAIDVPWMPRSILRSEAFAFCLMCDHYAIDGIVESGIYYGRSTEIFASYHSGTRITALDWAITDDAKRLTKYSNVRLQGTDSTVTLIPYVATAGSRVGVFIDGPKGGAAIRLAVECMKLKNVSFVGVHDMANLLHGDFHKARILLGTVGGKQWYTDEQWFVDRFAHLDVDESNWDDEQGTRWFPFTRFERGKDPVSLGSYGYTIGFLCK